jgi:hypothetical protein
LPLPLPKQLKNDKGIGFSTITPRKESYPGRKKWARAWARAWAR